MSTIIPEPADYNRDGKMDSQDWMSRPMNSDPVAERAVAPHLKPGERLLWASRPRQGMLLRPSDAFWIPFSLLWAGFAVFWEYQAIASGAPLSWRLWGVPFLFVGLYLVCGRFVLDIAMRSRTYYAATLQHAIIVSGLGRQRVAKLSTHDVPMTLSEKATGDGSILFRTGFVPRPAAALAWPGIASTGDYRFEYIDHAREVFDLLRKNADRKD